MCEAPVMGYYVKIPVIYETYIQGANPCLGLY